MHSRPKSYSFISLLFAAFFGIFISCSQNTPEITNTDYTVIFDYSDEDAAPSARLSLFAASESDVRRYQRVRVVSLETGYCWDTQIISMLEDENTQWAGCSNLVAPEDEKIPVGIYEVTYFNADEKECTVTIDVRYDIGFYDILLPALPDFMTENKGIEKIAIYDKEHILLYFGDRTEEFTTTRKIWNRYRNAATYQIIWYTNDGSVICITPEKTVSPDAN